MPILETTDHRSLWSLNHPLFNPTWFLIKFLEFWNFAKKNKTEI